MAVIAIFLIRINIVTGFKIVAALALVLPSVAAAAADYPAPESGDWIATSFKFHAGEVRSQLKLHYTTVGLPSGAPVLILHGSGGSAANVLAPAFAGELFGHGQPLDAAKYYIIIPDALGHGGSAKPSDGLKRNFRNTITPTWWTLNTGSCPKDLASIMRDLSSATRWAE
jgi:hypothetical protein